MASVASAIPSMVCQSIGGKSWTENTKPAAANRAASMPQPSSTELSTQNCGGQNRVQSDQGIEHHARAENLLSGREPADRGSVQVRRQRWLRVDEVDVGALAVNDTPGERQREAVVRIRRPQRREGE
jgi:hypothetical protein